MRQSNCGHSGTARGEAFSVQKHNKEILLEVKWYNIDNIREPRDMQDGVVGVIDLQFNYEIWSMIYFFHFCSMQNKKTKSRFTLFHTKLNIRRVSEASPTASTSFVFVKRLQ